MDKINTKKLIIFFNIACILIAVAAICGITVFTDVADAADESYVKSITAVVSADIVGGQVVSETGDYDIEGNFYAKGIVIVFDTSSASFYRFNITVDGQELGEGETFPVTDTETVYEVTQNGRVDVTIVLYGDEKNGDYGNIEIGRETVTVLSDNEPPEVPDSAEMTEYCGGTASLFYDVYIDTQADDSLSDVGRISYFSSYDSGLTEVTDKINGISKRIFEPTTFEVYYFDNAFNCVIKRYVYDKFDFTPPPKPIINVVPENLAMIAASDSDTDKPNGYASAYGVEIDFGNDNGSGVYKGFYSINNAAVTEYGSEFKITQENANVITAYSVDAVGNISEKATFVLSEVFEKIVIDSSVPTVASVDITYDITAEKIARISICTRDALSGIGDVKLRDEDIYFHAILPEIYELSYDCYGHSSFDIVITDKVGNSIVSHIVFGYFDDKNLSAKVKHYADWYKSADLNKYNEDAAEELRNKLGTLNVLLASSMTTQEDFNKIFKELDTVIEGSDGFTFEISKVPAYLSGAMTYSVDTDDFEDYRKGDEIKVVFSADGNDDLFVESSGFASGFSENFFIDIYYKGEKMNSLQNGIKVSLNLPTGYYERDFVLFDCDTDEKIETSIKNNKLEFTLKKSSRLSLVISGSVQKATADNNSKKGVNVFGHKLSVGAFVGAVVGGVALAAIGVVAILLIKRRHKE